MGSYKSHAVLMGGIVIGREHRLDSELPSFLCAQAVVLHGGRVRVER
jgi:hypothetical protein